MGTFTYSILPDNLTAGNRVNLGTSTNSKLPDNYCSKNLQNLQANTVKWPFCRLAQDPKIYLRGSAS